MTPPLLLRSRPAVGSGLPYYIGIDPGMSGAIAAIDDQGLLISAKLTPVTKIKKKKNSYATELDFGECRRLIRDELHAAENRTALVIERVHAMPGQGVTSMFSFGRGFGFWEGLAAGLNLRIVYVPPITWSKALLTGIPGSDTKEKAVVAFKRTFPRSDAIQKKKDYPIADAALIARYAFQQKL